MKRWQLAAAASTATAALTLVLGFTAGAGAAARQDSPPECQTARIIENSGAGPTMWVHWCGTGANGEPPMDATTYVLVNGGPLTPAACRRLAPCYAVWPASPAS